MTHEVQAAAGAAVTGSAGLTVWLANIELYLRVGVAVVGIAVGVITWLYYFEAWKEKRRNRDAS